MVRITTAINPRFKRFFHNCANGKTARICHHCGALVYGPNRGICDRCLIEQKKGGTHDAK